MKFSEMGYQRPDMAKIEKCADEISSLIESAASAADAEKAYMDWDSIERSFSTALNICYIRHSINTEDEFYSKENDFFDDNSPKFTECAQKVAKAITLSPFRKELEESLSRVFFINNELLLKGFCTENIPLMQEENRLVSEYEKLIASAQIEFEGKKRTISELAPYKQSTDDRLRHEAWQAESGFYAQHYEELDNIYDSMVKVRTAQGKKLGFDNYVPLGYINMDRNCYDENDIKAFRKSVIENIVPLADKLYRRQAERLGVAYPLKYENTALTYRTGNALPKGSPDDILEAGRRFYRGLSEETGVFFDFMMENELMDVLSRKGKMQGGYCTEIADYHCPFIFSNFNGTQGDAEVITHEAGHAFAAYTNRDPKILDTMLPTIEACEIHSMTMEFFAYRSAEDFFGENASKYIYKHLSDAIEFIPYGTMVDHFQHSVYEDPDMSPAQRIEEWKRLTALYMPWIDLDGSTFYGEGRAWQRQAHIYERPFYYIDYCLAQTAALEFFVLMQKDEKDAFRRYYELVKCGGRKTFRELIQVAGLDDPFGETALKNAAEKALEYIDSLEKNINE